MFLVVSVARFSADIVDTSEIDRVERNTNSVLMAQFKIFLLWRNH